MLTIAKRFEFHAAHSLPNHKGKCQNLHGHTYVLEVEVAELPLKIHKEEEQGMVMDFGRLKEIVNTNVIDKLDHSNLNEHYLNPTAEVMVNSIWLDLVNKLSAEDIQLQSLRLWETNTSYAKRTRNS